MCATSMPQKGLIYENARKPCMFHQIKGGQRIGGIYFSGGIEQLDWNVRDVSLKARSDCGLLSSGQQL